MPLGEHQRIGEPPAKNFSFLTRKLTSQVLPILLLHYYLHPCKNSPGGTIRCLPSLVCTSLDVIHLSETFRK